MTLIQFLWIAGLWTALVLVYIWKPSEGKSESVYQAAAKQVLTWIIGTGVVLWALLFFRAIGAFGTVQLP
jgi:hypothetical protein